MNPSTESFLSPYRFLDLTDDRGFLCGKILSSLGAEIIKIEPPGGDASRLANHLYQSDSSNEHENSLFWFAYNQGKKGITLNLQSQDGKALFKRLASTANGIIESFSPGYLDSLGLGYTVLTQNNPGLIFTSITPFGQDGPYKDWNAPDIVGMALGGYMYLCGDPDRAPVRISYPQAYLHAAGEAAVGTLIALYHWINTGEGQLVDVSMQESVAMLMFNSRGYWELDKTLISRQGPRRTGLSSGAIQRQTWPCRDGFVTFVVMAGTTGAKTNQALVQWMGEDGMADEYLRSIDWAIFDMATAGQEFHDEVEARIGRFFLKHTRDELTEGALKRRIMLYPVATVSDLLAHPQLIARDYWIPVAHPELGTTVAYPGPFIKSSPTPCVTGHRAPLVGEHNEEIYCKRLGVSQQEMVELRRRGVI